MGQPLFASEAEALAAEGEIYKHYKGGVYRLIQRGVRDCETLKPGILYEHLWPHDHFFWYRSEEDFFSNLPDGEPRFKFVKSQ